MPTPRKDLQRALRAHRKGHLDQAEALYRALLARAPDDAEALARLGAVYVDRGALPAAVDCLRRALAARPDDAEAWVRLADACRVLGPLPEALAAADRALALSPRDAGAHLVRGGVLAAMGRIEEAEASLTTAVELAPRSARACNDLGCLLLLAGRPEPAAEHLERAVALEPKAAQPHYYLGLARYRLGRYDAAEEALARATALNPRLADAHLQRARALIEAGRHDDAFAPLDRVLALNPDDPGAHATRAYLLGRLGLATEAAEAYREALGTNPGSYEVQANHLMFSCYDPDLKPADLLLRSRAWGERCLEGAGPVPPHANDPDPERVLNVGYLSPDLGAHAVARFIEPVLRHHDSDRFRVTCYANVARPDTMTETLRDLVPGWRDVVARSDEEVARAVRADGIDLLVDLAGHTGRSRLPVLARGPAPVQVSYLGYPATTGLSTIAWRLTDTLADPPGAEDAYSEGLWRVAPPFFCFQPPRDAPDVAPPPAASAPGVTFGCLLHPLKVNGRTIALWARVLRAVPDSRLLLFRYVLASRRARERILKAFAGAGIDADRIDLEWRRPETGGHFDLYRRIDIALDTVPFCGHTTTCEALWMGVPTVTRAGERFAGRMGVSTLTAAGLEDLVAPDDDAFVAIAAGLAADVPRLADLRAGLRERLKASPVCDAAGFTRRLEDAYRAMWRRWCEGARRA